MAGDEPKRSLKGLLLGLLVTVMLTGVEMYHLVRYVHVDPSSWSTLSRPGCKAITPDYTEMRCPLPGAGWMYLYCDRVTCIRHDPSIGPVDEFERVTLRLNSIRLAKDRATTIKPVIKSSGER